MKYRIKKETKPTLKTFGKYKAVAVHNQTIESRQLFEEAARHMTISGGVLEGMMMTVAETVRRHLQMGDKVRLRDFGLMKLEIESDKVDDPKTFRAKRCPPTLHPRELRRLPAPLRWHHLRKGQDIPTGRITTKNYLKKDSGRG